jgi:beta-galactosidase
MSRRVAADYTRRTLYSLLANGSIGALWWCHTDFTVPERQPYRANLMEYFGLGLYDVEGQPKPVAGVFREFAGVLKRLDTGALRKVPAQAAIVLPWRSEDHEVIFNAYALTRRAGIDADIVSPDDPLTGYRLIIVPSAAGHSHFNQPQWECIRARVAEGATLYVSSAGAVLPGINEMAGIEVQYRQGVTGERLALVITRSEGLPPGHVLRWEGAAPLAPHIAVTDGTIIAESADGRAFLVEHRWQRGSVVFCAEPVERYLCGKPGVARHDETWRLYRYLKSVAGIRAVVEAEQPDVECGLLREGDRLLAVLVNHSEEPLEARLAVDGSIQALDDLDGRSFPAKSGTCRIPLEANGGLVLRVIR